MPTLSITTLFLDIGGVLLTNGWDRQGRQQAADVFDLDHAEFDERHHLTFDTYEEGKLSLDDYLDRAVFYHHATHISRDEFKAFMFGLSQPYPDMLDLIRSLKEQYRLRVVAVSNEGRELNMYRIQTFNLRNVFDVFISSSFVHYRKPDLDIYRIALDVSQASPEEIVYIDDRLLFIQVAEQLGITGIHHTSYSSTRSALADLGLVYHSTEEAHEL